MIKKWFKKKLCKWFNLLDKEELQKMERLQNISRRLCHTRTIDWKQEFPYYIPEEEIKEQLRMGLVAHLPIKFEQIILSRFVSNEGYHHQRWKASLEIVEE